MSMRTLPPDIEIARKANMLPIQQIADKLGLSRERVRQIEQRALRRLRHARTRHELRKAWAQT